MKWKRIRNFKPKEFECPDCGESLMNERFVQKLDILREMIGETVTISHGGGYRCKQYNEKAGGNDNSPHMRGLGVDIRCTDAVYRNKLLEAVYSVGFQGKGIYDKHIHLDDYDRGICVAWHGISQ